MSTVTLRIAVDKAGASENIGQVKRDLDGLGATGAANGQQAAGGMNALSSAVNGAKAAVSAFVAAYAAVQTLTGVVRLADEYQGMSDRLRLATSSTAEFTAAQAGVFAIAQQTGSALGAVNDLYVGLSRSTEQLGLNQGQLLTITTAINQSFAVSGTSAASAEAATRQLGQAFASGVLRGDEFNSMMENAPGLASALAASLGVTNGELRRMAQEGQLTSEVLATGLLQQAPAIAEQFGQMGLTVGRAFTQLSNAVLQFVGEASQATGAASALAAIITGIANGLPAFAFGLTAVAAGYGAVAAAALVANPAIGFTGTLLAGAATAMGVLIAAYAGYKLGEYLVNEVTLVQAAVRSLYVGLNDAWTAIKVGALQAVAAIRVAFITAFDAITDRLADLIEAFVDFSQIELPLGLRADFAYGQAEAMTELAFRVRNATDAVVENDKVTGSLQDQMDTARAEAERYAASMFDAVDSLKEGKVATEATTTATTALKPALVATTAATRDAKTAVDLHKQALDAIRGSTIAYSSGLGTAVDRLADVTTATGAAGGAVGQFTGYIDESTLASQEWQRYWEGAVGAVTDAFGDFVASGFKSFNDLKDGLLDIAKRIVSDLVSTFLRSRITIPITAALTGGSGSALAGGLTGSGGGGIGGLLGGLLGGAGGLLGGSFGTGLLASGSIFSGAGLLGGITGSIGAGVSSIMGGSILQGLGLLAGPIGLLGGAIAALTSLFGRDKPPDVRFGGSQASIRNREGSFSTVFGNVQAGSRQISYEDMIGPIQQFDLAIQGIVQATGGGATQLEAIRGALATWEVDLRGSAATAENVLGSRFGAVLSAFSADVQGFVGTTGTLEERLSRFTDALSIAALAAGDNGITGSFTELADLLTRFRVDGEAVGDTFLRLSVGMSLVDDAMLLLGGTFQGTRLQAATFAGELIELAGGFDAFSARLNGALEALFTQDERNQFIADQAQSALNESLRGLNISGSLDQVRTQLRDQLRAAMESGNAELVNQLLIAGNALGAFSNAVGALGDDAVAAARQLLFGTSPTSGGSIGAGSGLTSPAGTASAPQTQLQASVAAATSLQAHTGLLTRIADNTTPKTASDPATKIAKDGSDASRSAAETLKAIKQLLEQAARAQTQEALKRTTGANKRTSAT